MPARQGLRNSALSKRQPRKVPIRRRLSATRNRPTGAACGTTRGALEWTTRETRATHPCIATYLWSNAPKETLEFADYSFEEHFGRPIASYPPRPVLFDYIAGRVKKAGVRHSIRFNTVVRDVRYCDATGLFSVTSRNEETDSESAEDFDHVIVATGHFSRPNVPYYQGFESYNGRILHAHDFRDAQEFADKDILIIGTSYSAEDIGSQCWKYGCKSVTVSHRTAPTGYDWPENWQEVPALVRVDGKTANFKDGTSKNVDAIIMCTGYKYYFPFLPDDLRLKTANRLAPTDLYKGIVWNRNPKLFYLGMQNQFYTFTMFDAQAWYVRDIIMGRIALPAPEVMAKDVVDRQTAEDALETEDALEDHKAGARYQGEYICELIAETDYPKFDVEMTNTAFIQWLDHKKQGIMTFRNNGYVSALTGVKSPAHHTPWAEALDDSLAAYLRTE